MTEVPEYINGSDTICHYTRFLGFWEPNCNCCRVGVSKMAELLHLFAEDGLARAALQHGARTLVSVSTDKAVNPHSIMGASKRVAELVVTALGGPECRMNAVRLGNVAGSSGSVLPIFREQIDRRGPLT